MSRPRLSSLLLTAMLTLLALAIRAKSNPPAGQDDFRRAGQPQEVSRFARPSDVNRSIGYYIGGGALNRHRADPPTLIDGTWGWDYTGGLFRRRVDLGWWHGRRFQGGSGAYKTDGPKLIREE
jgi:hypothetical protein